MPDRLAHVNREVFRNHGCEAVSLSRNAKARVVALRCDAWASERLDEHHWCSSHEMDWDSSEFWFQRHRSRTSSSGKKPRRVNGKIPTRLKLHNANCAAWLSLASMRAGITLPRQRNSPAVCRDPRAPFCVARIDAVDTAMSSRRR